MAWTAVITRIDEQPGNAAALDVTYTSDGKSFVKAYSLHPGTFRTAKDVEDLLRQEVVSLEAIDIVRTAITHVRDKVGVITAGVVSVDPDVDIKDAATLEDAALEISKDKP